MAETDFQFVARSCYPRARLISGNGPYAILRTPDVILFQSWSEMNVARNPLENWIKLSEPKPSPRFNARAIRFQKMVDLA